MAGLDTESTGTPYPIWGFGPPSPEPDTKNLDALLDSLNGSAERFQTLWFSFLGLTLYLAIAALATTHRNLLLGEPQVLPILNIKVELLPFYVIAPLLYLVFHFYLLMMLALLARTSAEFDKQLRTTLPGKPEQERYRAQVGNALFLQLLVGMKGERTGVNALLMGLIALITIVLAPLATLVLMQMMFLPYHHFRITWWHRGIVVADFALIVVMTYRCFFPRGVRKAPLVLGALSRKPRWATAMAFCVLLAVGLWSVAYWLSFSEGRWAGEPTASSLGEWTDWMRGKPPALPELNPDYAATEGGVVFGLFPDRLKLKDEIIIGEKTIGETVKEMDSRGGEFVPTIKLDGRDLQAADLSDADLRGSSLSLAAIQGANLSFTRLDGAHLDWAQLQGTNLPFARLQGANLAGAQLQGANLGGAQLQGANLGGAQLQGAILSFAGLQGADLKDAELQGTDLEFAQLLGTDLEFAQLQGAQLRHARLQGADLGGADLQGADLSAAQLQGADLRRANLEDCELVRTFVFGTGIGDANLATAAMRSIRAEKFKVDLVDDSPLTAADVETWSAAAAQFAPETDKADIAKRFDRLRAGLQTGDPRDAEEVTWTGMQEASLTLDPNGAEHRRRLALFLGELACKDDGAPYVARRLVTPVPSTSVALLSRARLAALGDQLERVRNRIEEGRKTPEKCPGVVGFTDEDWRALEAIKPIEPAPTNH